MKDCRVTINIPTGLSHAHLLEPQGNMIELISVSKKVEEKEKESLNDNEWIYSPI
jgi:hypothetical protein